jgi:hypothetical protein
MSTVEMRWVKCLRDESNGGFCISGVEPLVLLPPYWLYFEEKEE